MSLFMRFVIVKIAIKMLIDKEMKEKSYLKQKSYQIKNTGIAHIANSIRVCSIKTHFLKFVFSFCHCDLFAKVIDCHYINFKYEVKSIFEINIIKIKQNITNINNI